MNLNDYEVVSSHPTREETSLLTYAEGTPMRNVSLARDLLLRIVTLAPVLCIGSAAFLQKDLIHPGARIAAVASFLMALAVAIVGVIPFVMSVEYEANQIRSFLSGKLKTQLWALGVSGFLLLSGFLSVLAGLIAGPLN